MSLLMDALKKAEKARQAQASRASDEGPAQTREFSLDSIEFTQSDEGPSEPAASPGREEHAPLELEPPQAAELPPEETASGLRLEDTGPEFEAAGDEQEPGGRQPDFSLLEGLDEPPRAEDASSTMPSLKSVRASVDQYFDGTQSMSMSMDELRAAMEQGDTGPRRRQPAAAGGDTTAGRRAARAVMEAKTVAGHPTPRTGSRTLWLVLLPLVVIALVAGGLYYYTMISTGPSLVRRQPLPPPVAPARTTAATARPGAVHATPPAASAKTVPAKAATASVAGAAAAQPAASRTEPVAHAPSRGDLTPGAQPVVRKPAPSIPMPPAPSVKEVVKQPQPGAAAPASPATVAQRVARAIQAAGMGGHLGPAAAAIRISKARRADPLHPLLARAYGAYRHGDYRQAAGVYHRVLKRDAGNHDALMGLAAVAIREHHSEQAARMYLRVLQLHPHDALARAGLIDLNRHMDPVAGETMLKELIQRDPQVPHLYFSLGNLYAAQGRWSLAQEAYFNAYKRDATNPDYVFNLAVSLDHLSQRTPALRFYRQALRLADSHPAGFDTASALKRIHAITADARAK